MKVNRSVPALHARRLAVLAATRPAAPNFFAGEPSRAEDRPQPDGNPKNVG
jgi:hypothetical protein